MRYVVKLKPFGPYFFGGSVTFGDGSYIAYSKLLPQQTTLLGLLRIELLRSYGLLTKKVRGEWVDEKERVDEVIGTLRKFDFDLKEKQDYGKIASISPLMLTNGSDLYFYGVDYSCYTIGSIEPPQIKCYDPKEGLKELAFSHRSKRAKCTLFNFFEQVGIKKSARSGKKVNKEERKEAFYKKSSVILDESFAFASIVEGEDLERLDGRLVHFGGERSPFMLSVKKSEQSFEDIVAKLTPPIPKGSHKMLYLLSDAYLPAPLKELCTFAITQEEPTAYIKREWTKSSKVPAFKKSEQIFLYRRGSLFIDPKEKLFTLLHSEALRQIGYNHYKEIQ